MKLEQLLSTMVPGQNFNGDDIEISPEFRVAIQSITPEGVKIIIHANGHNSETLDFIVSGNELTAL